MTYNIAILLLLYITDLCLPLHSSDRDAQQQDDGERADDPDVIDLIRHESVYTLKTQRQQCASIIKHYEGIYMDDICDPGAQNQS